MNKIRRFAAFALVLALMLLTVFVPAVHAGGKTLAARTRRSIPCSAW